jgi:hypothetical protein
MCAAILAVVWITVAWAYHIERYATINWAATYFGVAFGIEALLLAWRAAWRKPLELRRPHNVADWLGLAVVVFGLVGAPLVERAVGRMWPQVEMFGITPDATAIVTLGVLALARRAALMVVPALWCLISGALSWAMEAPDALVPPIAAALAIALAFAGRGDQAPNRPA